MLNSDNRPQSPSDTAPATADADPMEMALQQELRSMFEVDTQKGIETYLDQTSHLQPQTWTQDIQTLYRTVHTIKGGAVTVGATAILQVATALEDLLSDLRNTGTAPLLEDGRLVEILTEAGELLASSSLMEAQNPAAETDPDAAAPSVQRIQDLRSQVQADYLPQWSQQQHLQQDFAQQGFDLVVLELEIGLENLQDGALPQSIVDTARSILEQLSQIGQALQLASGWPQLLAQGETLLEPSRQKVYLWRTQWPCLFHGLKQCIETGGEPVDFALAADEGDSDRSEATGSELVGATLPRDRSLEGDGEDLISDAELADFDAIFAGMALLDDGESLEEVDGDPLQALPASAATDGPANHADTGALDPLAALDLAISATTPMEANADAAEDSSNVSPERAASPESVEAAQVQIPVPLERLDRSAQNLVNALLSIRSTQGVYSVLQEQILQLSSLAQEGVQYITRLRQIQDDYALVDDLQVDLRRDGPTPERYRQGYVTINRLLETNLRLSELGAETEKTAREMTESLQTLDSNVLDLQATVEESRLVPFRNLAFRARAILRDLTTRFGKPAKLILQGEQIELDVGSIRSLEPALLHLIRNAFDHALEPAAEREALGKPPQGTLTLSLQRLGNIYRLRLTDDGCGIDAAQIRDRALALGLPLTDTSTPAALLAVLCQPGFSAKASVNDVSGRGVGMDVVAAQIAKMGGKLTLKTTPGQGTTLSLQFPVPHLLVPCLLLRAGDRCFAIPFEDAKRVALLDNLIASPPSDDEPGHLWDIEADGPGLSQALPGLDLLDYWQPQGQRRTLDSSAVCAYVQSSDDEQGLWLIADEMLGQSDLLINALPSPLQPPEGMMGVSLQPDGTLVPVLNGSAIAHQVRSEDGDPAAIAPASPSQPKTQELTSPTILIVDDAALMRRRIEASLSANGHVTQTCADGLEAWNWLKANPRPALLITDIEMPNMDGFTLLDRCRQERMTMPILVVSSRLSEDWFTEARRLGADDYLTKGFSTVDLLNKVNDLMALGVS